MNGIAEFKTNVLSRDEKGFFGIPFKRIMTAGVSSAMAFMFGKPVLGTLTIPAVVAVFVLTVIALSEVGGLPLYQRLYLGLRGSLILAAVEQAEGRVARLASGLALPVQLAQLDADVIFAPPSDGAVETDWSGVTIYGSPFEAGRGVEYVPDPLAGLLGGGSAHAAHAVD